jgi:hypothetical protein
MQEAEWVTHVVWRYLLVHVNASLGKWPRSKEYLDHQHVFFN